MGPAIRLETLGHLGRQRDSSAASRPLGLLKQPASLLPLHGALDRQLRLLKVNILDSQREVLARPQACGDRKQKDRSERMSLAGIGETGRLRTSQRDNVRRLLSRQDRVSSRILLNQFPLDGLLKRRVQNRMGVSNRSRRQFLLDQLA